MEDALPRGAWVINAFWWCLNSHGKHSWLDDDGSPRGFDRRRGGNYFRSECTITDVENEESSRAFTHWARVNDSAQHQQFSIFSPALAADEKFVETEVRGMVVDEGKHERFCGSTADSFREEIRSFDVRQ